MKRRRARLLAVVIVLLSAVATAVVAAPSDFQVTESTSIVGSANYMIPMRVIVSLRNVSASSQTIQNIQLASPQPMCLSGYTITRIVPGGPDGVAANIVLAKGEQVQLKIEKPMGFGSSETNDGAFDPTCNWTANTTAGPIAFTTIFQLNHGSPIPYDVTPKSAHFGTVMLGGSATQRFLTSNHQGGTIPITSYEIANDFNQAFAFATGGCGTSKVCNTPAGVIGNTPLVVDIVCQPTMTGVATAKYQVKNGTTVVAESQLECSGAGPTADIKNIYFVNPPYHVGAPSWSTPVMVSSTMLPSQLVMASIDNPSFALSHGSVGACSNQTCTFAMGQAALPTTLNVSCIASNVTQTANLSIVGTGGMDFDMTTVTCDPFGAMTGLSVSPNAVTVTPTQVGNEVGPFMVTVANGTGAPVTFTALVSDPAWRVGSCGTGSSCTVPNNGSAMVGVFFRPTMVKTYTDTLTIDAGAAGMPTVSLTGSGSGTGTGSGRLDVITPPAPFVVDLGTIARNQPATRTVTLAATGSAGTMVTIGTPPAPFGVSTTLLSVGPGGMTSFDVTCQSPTNGTFSSAITIGSMLQQNTPSVTAMCTVADTDVLVTPASFDFGEVRVASETQRMPFTITNPGPPVMLRHVRLRVNPPMGLSVTQIAPRMLGTGQAITGEVILVTGAETDLEGAFLEVGVGTSDLALPITGAVVRPSAQVSPTMLDLGTACVGRQVSGAITLVNDGTATLHVEQPVMDSTMFAVSATMPQTLPADVRAGEQATVSVSPSTTADGEIASTMTWSVDAPQAPFSIPVSLAYISDGTALSPQRLGFGYIEVDAISPEQEIRLENCGTETVTVTVRGVRPTEGTASAWHITPKAAEMPLGSRVELPLYVRFAPKEPGMHRARVEIDVDGELQYIDLEGFAPGERRDMRSFYACSCSGNGEPSRGWPIALAIVLIVLPRRRRR